MTVICTASGHARRTSAYRTQGSDCTACCTPRISTVRKFPVRKGAVAARMVGALTCVKALCTCTFLMGSRFGSVTVDHTQPKIPAKTKPDAMIKAPRNRADTPSQERVTGATGLRRETARDADLRPVLRHKGLSDIMSLTARFMVSGSPPGCTTPIHRTRALPVAPPWGPGCDPSSQARYSLRSARAVLRHPP